MYLFTYLLTYLTHIGSSYLWNYIELCINTYRVLRGDLHRDLNQGSFLEARSKRMSKEASQGIGWEGEVHTDGRICGMRFVWGNLCSSRGRCLGIRSVPARQAPRVWWWICIHVSIPNICSCQSTELSHSPTCAFTPKSQILIYPLLTQLLWDTLGAVHNGRLPFY